MKPHILRVFVNSEGKFGDQASVIIDEGRKIPDTKRQEITRQLNTGETAFVNDLTKANISIVHPQGEIAFAGVATLATAWLIGTLRSAPATVLHGRDGDIQVWQDGELTWVRANLNTMPPWNYKQLDSAQEVERLKLTETKTWQHTMAWAWIDEAKGLIRARTFATDWDIPEAEGNGSGSMVLATKLKRDIEIKHGEGSVIFAKPADNNSADIGGRVIDDHFIHDSDELKSVLLRQGASLSDAIDKLERTSDDHVSYYSYLKDFLINSGCLCDDILRAIHTDYVLLGMIGARTLLEDAINVHYLESRAGQAKQMTVAKDWFRISNDRKTPKNKLDGKSVAGRARASGKDVKELYENEYADFCNYTHSAVQRSILNIPDHRSLGGKKAVMVSLQAYANILTCVARITGEEMDQGIEDLVRGYFDKYRESVATATLPIEEA